MDLLSLFPEDKRGQAQTARQLPARFPGRTEFGENFGAAWRYQRDVEMAGVEEAIRYEVIDRALETYAEQSGEELQHPQGVAQGPNRDRYTDFVEERFEAAGVPYPSEEEIHAQVLAELRVNREEYERFRARPSTTLGDVGDFLGGAAGAASDPVFLGTAVGGLAVSGARTILGTVAQEAFLGFTQEALVQASSLEIRREAFGAGVANRESLFAILLAGGLGSIFGAAGAGIVKMIEARHGAKTARDVDNILTQEHITEATNPLEPTVAGIDANRRALRTAKQQIDRGEPVDVQGFVAGKESSNTIAARRAQEVLTGSRTADVEDALAIAESVREERIQFYRYDIDELKRSLNQPGEQSLFGFIRAQGGIQPEAFRADEVRAVTQDSSLPPGFWNHKGTDPDTLAQTAWEAGYLPGAERPDLQQLYDAIDREARGAKVYPAEVEAEIAGQIQYRDQVEREIAELGFSLNDPTDRIARALADAETPELTGALQARQLAIGADRRTVQLADQDLLRALDDTGTLPPQARPGEPVEGLQAPEEARAPEIAPAAPETALNDTTARAIDEDIQRLVADADFPVDIEMPDGSIRRMRASQALAASDEELAEIQQIAACAIGAAA